MLAAIKSGQKEEAGGAGEASGELISKEVQQYIRNLVDRLTPQQRRVFLLAREGGLKQEEIAKLLGISVFVVKKHMVNALKFMREEIGKTYGPQAVAVFVIFGMALA